MSKDDYPPVVQGVPSGLSTEDIEHLIARLLVVVDLLRSDKPVNRHMASAKILADIAVLRTLVPGGKL